MKFGENDVSQDLMPILPDSAPPSQGTDHLLKLSRATGAQCGKCSDRRTPISPKSLKGRDTPAMRIKFRTASRRPACIALSAFQGWLVVAVRLLRAALRVFAAALCPGWLVATLRASGGREGLGGFQRRIDRRRRLFATTVTLLIAMAAAAAAGGSVGIPQGASQPAAQGMSDAL